MQQAAPFTISQPTTRARRSTAQRCILILAGIQLLLALGIILFGGIAMGLSLKYSYYENYYSDSYRSRQYVQPVWLDGTPFWGGALIAISSTIGLVACLKPAHKCPRIAYLVLVILSAVMSGVICIIGAIWAVILRYSMIYGPINPVNSSAYSAVKGVIGLNGFISVIAFICMICCIISASLWCYQYTACCRDENTQPGQIIYLSNLGDTNSAHGVAPIQGFNLPNGTAGGQPVVSMTDSDHTRSNGTNEPSAPEDSTGSKPFGYRTLDEN